MDSTLINATVVAVVAIAAVACEAYKAATQSK
jgi:hypothetical protein